MAEGHNGEQTETRMTSNGGYREAAAPSTSAEEGSDLHTDATPFESGRFTSSQEEQKEAEGSLNQGKGFISVPPGFHMDCPRDCRKFIYDAILCASEMDRKIAFEIKTWTETNIFCIVEGQKHSVKMELVQNLDAAPFLKAFRDASTKARNIILLVTENSLNDLRQRYGELNILSQNYKYEFSLITLTYGFDDKHLPDDPILSTTLPIRYEPNEDHFIETMRTKLTSYLHERLKHDAVREECARQKSRRQHQHPQKDECQHPLTIPHKTKMAESVCASNSRSRSDPGISAPHLNAQASADAESRKIISTFQKHITASLDNADQQPTRDYQGNSQPGNVSQGSTGIDTSGNQYDSDPIKMQNVQNSRIETLADQAAPRTAQKHEAHSEQNLPTDVVNDDPYSLKSAKDLTRNLAESTKTERSRNGKDTKSISDENTFSNGSRVSADDLSKKQDNGPSKSSLTGAAAADTTRICTETETYCEDQADKIESSEETVTAVESMANTSDSDEKETNTLQDGTYNEETPESESETDRNTELNAEKSLAGEQNIPAGNQHLHPADHTASLGEERENKRNQTPEITTMLHANATFSDCPEQSFADNTGGAREKIFRPVSPKVIREQMGGSSSHTVQDSSTSVPKGREKMHKEKESSDEDLEPDSVAFHDDRSAEWPVDKKRDAVKESYEKEEETLPKSYEKEEKVLPKSYGKEDMALYQTVIPDAQIYGVSKDFHVKDQQLPSAHSSTEKGSQESEHLESQSQDRMESSCTSDSGFASDFRSQSTEGSLPSETTDLPTRLGEPMAENTSYTSEPIGNQPSSISYVKPCFTAPNEASSLKKRDSTGSSAQGTAIHDEKKLPIQESNQDRKGSEDVEFCRGQPSPISFFPNEIPYIDDFTPNSNDHDLNLDFRDLEGTTGDQTSASRGQSSFESCDQMEGSKEINPLSETKKAPKSKSTDPPGAKESTDKAVPEAKVEMDNAVTNLGSSEMHTGFKTAGTVIIGPTTINYLSGQPPNPPGATPYPGAIPQPVAPPPFPTAPLAPSPSQDYQPKERGGGEEDDGTTMKKIVRRHSGLDEDADTREEDNDKKEKKKKKPSKLSKWLCCGSDKAHKKPKKK